VAPIVAEVEDILKLLTQLDLFCDLQLGVVKATPIQGRRSRPDTRSHDRR
jgi:hypothetical protein